MVLNNTCECMHTLCKNVCGLVYIYIYIHIHVYIYICIHAYIDIYIHTYTYTYIYAWIYIYIHTHIYVHIHICIYICICTHLYIYLHNSCMRACATVQQLPCHGRYCKLILIRARTSCRLSFPPALLPLRRAGRPPAGPLTDLFAKKSDQIHASSWRGRRCSVAQASSDSFALVRASSNLSMVHTRAWPRISPLTKI